MRRVFPGPSGAIPPTPASFDRGVASAIEVVDGPDGPFVVKRALAKLRVAADWRSDPARSAVEAAALEAMAGLLGEGVVPKVLWTDPARNRFAMTLIPPRLRNWKRDLLAGRVDLRTASRAGQLLGQLHARSAGRSDIATRFADTRYFEELRIAPYFTRAAERNPDLAPHIERAVRGMAAHRQALVHGDFSPKNILADGDDVVLLDCEVAHWGDPRFDLAFCLTHLALKALRRGAAAEALAAAASALRDAYLAAGPPIADADLVRLIGCLMLARLEGDSPVDYLGDLDRPAVKALAAGLLRNPSSCRAPGLLPSPA